MNTASTGSGSAQEPAGGRSAAARSLQWLLVNLVEEVPGVRSVAVISSDGLMLCSSDSDADSDTNPTTGTASATATTSPTTTGTGKPPRSRGDLATVVSGLASLTDGAARLMDAGTVKQSVVAMDNGCLFVMAISDGSLLGVHASPECDMSVVAYHMALFVGRAGHVLTPELRSELAAPGGPQARDTAPEGTP